MCLEWAQYMYQGLREIYYETMASQKQFVNIN